MKPGDLILTKTWHRGHKDGWTLELVISAIGVSPDTFGFPGWRTTMLAADDIYVDRFLRDEFEGNFWQVVSR